MAHEFLIELREGASTSSVFLQTAIAVRTRRLDLHAFELNPATGSQPARFRLVTMEEHSNLPSFLEHLRTISEAKRVSVTPPL
jgi:hypothetical protein